MLCEFAHSFPTRIAGFLERDRGLKRNFREETVTDLLMASLIGMEPFGVRVDFPPEPTTGGDMEWVFAAPREASGGRYFRLILQAKRAQFAKLKSGGYWYYRHLDHGDPKGSQAQTLIAHASNSNSTLALYILYHSSSALEPATGGHPAIEGINLVFASHVAPIVLGGCGTAQKKVDYWRGYFMRLSDILCWPTFGTVIPIQRVPRATQFIVDDRTVALTATGGFHPDIVARRLRRLIERGRPDQSGEPPPPIAASDEIPDEIQRALRGHPTDEDRANIERPRAIFFTDLRRDDPRFARADEFSRQSE